MAVLKNTVNIGDMLVTGIVRASDALVTGTEAIGGNLSVNGETDTAALKVNSSTVAVASGDAIVIGDSSDSNRIKRSQTVFGNASGKYLKNDGTWDTPTGTTPNTADLKIKAGTNGTAVTVFNADASSDSTIELGAGSSTDWDVNFAINSNKKITGTVVHPTIPSITLNGASSTSPSFYAPTSAGTLGLALISNGSGAPSWGTVSTSDEKVKQNVVTSSSYPLLASSASSPTSGNTYSSVYASDVLLTFYNNVGRINSVGGFYQTSDIRKKDIVSDLPLDKAYDLIDKCQTIIYTLKDRNQEQLGLIAQEVQEFFPEIVNTDENGYLSLDYAKLTVVILKVLKDLINRVSKLESYDNR